MVDDEDAEIRSWAAAAATSVAETMNEVLRLLNFYLEVESDQMARTFLQHFPDLCLPGNVRLADMILDRARDRGDTAAVARLVRRRRMVDEFARQPVRPPATRGHGHSWRETKMQQANAIVDTEWCTGCGAGFELSFRPRPGQVDVGFIVFAAAGRAADQIDPEAIARGLRQRARAVDELRQQGLHVAGGSPRFTGPRKGSAGVRG